MTQPQFETNLDSKLFFTANAATYGTVVIPAANDAFRFISDPVIQPGIEQITNEERGQGRSQVKAGIGRTAPTVSYTTYLRPPGAQDVAPAIGPQIALVMGATDTAGGTNRIRYHLAADQTDDAQLSYETNLTQYIMYGLALNSMTMNWTGNGFTTVQFAGPFQDYATAVPFTSSAISGSSISPPSGIDARDLAGVGSILTGEDSTQLVTAVSSTAIMTAVAVAAGANKPITLGLPTPDYGTQSDANYGTVGRLSLDSGTTEVRHLSGSLTVNNGVRLVNNEFGTNRARAVVSPGRRNITISLTMEAEKVDIQRLSAIRRNTTYNTEVRFGLETGRRMEIIAPQAQFTPTAPTPVNNDVSQITLTGQLTAPGSDDELALDFY